MVTSGRVCTFLGRDRATREQAVIWTFECPGNAVELSTAAIVARFCNVAPNPPGMVLAAGTDEQSSTAFIATNMPAADLDAWVVAYQSFRPGARPGASAPPTAASVPRAPIFGDTFGEKSPPSSPNPSSANPSSTAGGFGRDTDRGKSGAGEFTSFFRSPFEQPASPSTPVVVPETRSAPLSKPSAGEFTGVFGKSEFEREVSSPRPAPESIPRPAVGSFTQAFGPGGSSLGAPLGSGKLDEDLPAARSPFSESTSGPPAPGSFTQMFSGGGSTPVPSESTPPARSPFSEPASAPQAPGSFTQMFSGGGGSTPAPLGSAPSGRSPFSEPESAPRAPGSFTQIFGGGGSAPGPMPSEDFSGARSPFAEPATAPQAPGSFTQIFGGTGSAPPPSDNFASARSPFSEPVSPSQPAGSFTQVFGGMGTTPAPVPTESFPATGSPARPVTAGGGGPAAPAPFQPDPFAPRVSPIVAAPVVTPPASHSRQVAEVPGGDAPAEEPTRRPSEFTMFLNRDQMRALLPAEPAGGAAPAAGGGPAQVFAPPAMPAPPAPPAVKLAPPAIPVPKPPAMAAPGAAPAGSILPLITVLVVLVAIGALLVMYFVMKH
jgi:hypothetical protein